MTVANIRALVAKDTHHLFPLVIAFLALEVLGLLDSFLTRSPDSMTWSELSILLNPELADLTGVLYVIFGMVAAYMMFPHEGKQQTLQFLWSLPVRRWHIYAVKLATALLVVHQPGSARADGRDARPLQIADIKVQLREPGQDGLHAVDAGEDEPIKTGGVFERFVKRRGVIESLDGDHREFKRNSTQAF